MVELKTRVIRGSTEGPHLLITAGVHGDEFEGVASVRQLITTLEPSRLCGQVTLVPVVNESAFRRRNRCGADGLDLARTCPGNPEGSITEQVAHELSNLIRVADYYIDLHSGGILMDVYPLAGYMLVKSAEELDAQRGMANSFGLPLVWGTSDQLDGRSLSVARDANVPAIYVEYRGTGQCDPLGVVRVVDGCLNVMTDLDMIDRKFLSEDQPLVVEDETPGSGHMQECYPAPFAGLFQPSVPLGTSVNKGAVIGTLSDPFSDRNEAVLAKESGAVIVFRTYPEVQQGDALAVILETDQPLPQL